MKLHQKGFTLIELLVVISIIALLSSVVLSSLNVARAKAADAVVKAAIKHVAAQAEQYRDTNSNFGTSVVLCSAGVFGDTKVAVQIAQIAVNLISPSTITCTTSVDGYKWAMSVANLKYAKTTYCVDNNQGWAKPGTSVLGMCS